MKNEQLLQAIGHISDELVSAAAPQTSIKRSAFTMKKAFALASALLLAAALSIPALAATDYEPAYQLLYSLSPAIAQRLKPVRLSSEDKGIRLEVISADVTDNEAQIYLSLTDLTSDRLDQSTDLFDSYGINAPTEISGGCQNVGYDPQTKTARFLLSLTQPENQDITGDKISFGLRQILSKKQTFDGPLSGLTLPDASLSAQMVKPAQLFGGGGEGYDGEMNQVLVPAPGGSFLSPTKGVDISAMGYVDGKLHIQLQFANVLETDNNGYIYFKNPQGDIIRPQANYVFATDAAGKERYEEQIFDVSQEDLANFTPHGYFVTSDSLIQGNWSVTFPLESIK